MNNLTIGLIGAEAVTFLIGTAIILRMRAVIRRLRKEDVAVETPPLPQAEESMWRTREELVARVPSDE